jgi:(2Fe-2S) ferredoxin
MEKEQLQQIAVNKGYSTARRHIFLCISDKCAPSEASNKLWEYLKKRLSEIEPDSSKATILRNKVACLRICSNGPTALVYPEGTLYYDLTEEKLEKIIQEHLLQGKPVHEYSFFQKSL